MRESRNIQMTDVVWLEQSQAELPAGDEWFGESEAATFRALRFEKRRSDWRLGRWTAKRAVAAHLGMDERAGSLARLEIVPAPSGAPEVFLDRRPVAIAISLSHRNGVALCALGSPGAELGCDLELIEPRSASFAETYFTAKELEIASAAPPESRAYLETLVWSAKESALKALGAGLQLDTRMVRVDLSGTELEGTPQSFREWSPLRVCYTNGETFGGWWRYEGRLLRSVVAWPPPHIPNPIAAAIRA